MVVEYDPLTILMLTLYLESEIIKDLVFDNFRCWKSRRKSETFLSDDNKPAEKSQNCPETECRNDLVVSTFGFMV